MEASGDSTSGGAEARIRALDAERQALEGELARRGAELTRVRLRVEELEDQHAFDQQRLGVVDRERTGLRAGLEKTEQALQERIAPLEARIEALTIQRDELAAMVAEAGEARLQNEEQRALVRHLARTQATLEVRTEQLSSVLSSRWYRIARSTWQARRRRPPLGALGLAALAVAVIAVSAALASSIVVVIAGVLGAAIVFTLAVTYTIVVPALRDHRTPRMAGQGTFAEPLPVETAGVQSALSRIEAEPESVNGGAVAPPALAAAGPAAAAPQPDRTDAPARVVTRLVPALHTTEGHERESWLAATRTLELGQLRVAGILDDMSRACFGPECELNCEFTMADWRERLEPNPPHMLLVESAWSGNSGGWQYGVASYPHPDYQGLPELRRLLSWCEERGIPTVFWNKEDPIHFERFKEAAALFDHVLTTDANRIPAYEDLGGDHDRTVHALPFAAQPRLHNPIAVTDARQLEPVFAGTYYRERHRDRQASLEMILDAALPYGLVIYDRTFGTESDEYGFPERFQASIKGRLPYQEVVDVYKRHRVFLNVNSVVDSPTMFSRRVFELLACGTAVLSTDSVGIEAIFGDLVPIATTPQGATAQLERLLHDDAYYTDLVGRARRLVLTEHTYRVRLSRIAAIAGFELSPTAGREVAALALVQESADLEAIEDAMLAQSLAPDEILVGIGDDALAEHGLERLTEHFGPARIRRVLQTTGVEAPQRWRELAAMSAARWVAPLSSSAEYGEHHLRDLTACTDFADGDVIGSAAEPHQAHRYVDSVDPSYALAAREVVSERGWSEDAGEHRRWFDQGVRFYAGEVKSGTQDGFPAATAADSGVSRNAPRRTRGTRRR